jgi:hypothetical protein
MTLFTGQLMTSKELYLLRDQLAMDLARDSTVQPHMQAYMMMNFKKALPRPVVLAITILVCDHNGRPRPQRAIQRFLPTLLWFINSNWSMYEKALETFHFEPITELFTLYGHTEQLRPGHHYPNLCKNLRQGVKIPQMTSAQILIVERYLEQK